MHLLKDTMSVFTLLFVAEVVYFSLTLNVADLGGSLHINYFISGLSELVSIAFCAILLAYLSRRMCLSLLLLASTVSYLSMALVNIYEESLAMTLILAVNAFGKLTAIGNLMVIILVSQEVFPTVIRQFGTSLCITVGKVGSAVAPFTHELGQIIGQSYCFGMFSLICLSCAIIPFVLSETGNRELPDSVNDVEEGANRRRKQNMSKPADSEKYISYYMSNKPTTDLKNGAKSNTNYGSGGQKQDRNNSEIFCLNPIGPFENQTKQQLIEDDMNNNNDDNIYPNINAYTQNGISQTQYSNHVNNNDLGRTGPCSTINATNQDGGRTSDKGKNGK